MYLACKYVYILPLTTLYKFVKVLYNYKKNLQYLEFAKIILEKLNKLNLVLYTLN